MKTHSSSASAKHMVVYQSADSQKSLPIGSKSKTFENLPAMESGAGKDDDAPSGNATSHALMWHQDYHRAKGEEPDGQRFTMSEEPASSKEENEAASGSGGNMMQPNITEWHARENVETDREMLGNTGDYGEIDIGNAAISYAHAVLGGVAVPLFVRQPEQNCRAVPNEKIFLAYSKLAMH